MNYLLTCIGNVNKKESYKNRLDIEKYSLRDLNYLGSFELI